MLSSLKEKMLDVRKNELVKTLKEYFIIENEYATSLLGGMCLLTEQGAKGYLKSQNAIVPVDTLSPVKDIYFTLDSVKLSEGDFIKKGNSTFVVTNVDNGQYWGTDLKRGTSSEIVPTVNELGIQTYKKVYSLSTIFTGKDYGSFANKFGLGISSDTDNPIKKMLPAILVNLITTLTSKDKNASKVMISNLPLALSMIQDKIDVNSFKMLDIDLKEKIKKNKKLIAILVVGGIILYTLNSNDNKEVQKMVKIIKKWKLTIASVLGFGIYYHLQQQKKKIDKNFNIFNYNQELIKENEDINQKEDDNNEI